MCVQHLTVAQNLESFEKFDFEFDDFGNSDLVFWSILNIFITNVRQSFIFIINWLKPYVYDFSVTVCFPWFSLLSFNSEKP